MAKFDQETLRKLHDCKEVADEPQSIPEAPSPSGSWFPAPTFLYVLCVGSKDAGIGTWPTAALPRWSLTVSS